MKNYIVYGAGISGNGAKKLLEKYGNNVFLVDDKMAITSEEAKKIIDENKIEALIKSPGISWENTLLDYAKLNNIEIIDEIELAYRYKGNFKIIAVTGTNGKSTTTVKISELLNYAGFKSEYAGNIGNSFAQLIIEGKDLDFVVLELSSYQLEALKSFRADIAMIINLTPDHLTRYNSLKEYYKTKFNIFNNQNLNDYAILNKDDNDSMEILKEINLNSNKIEISSINEAMSYYRDNYIYYKNEKILDVRNAGLKGKHNIENMLFIVSTAKILEISNEIIEEFLYLVKPLEHRTELFFKKNNLIFINDSKGTNLDSTIKALSSYNQKVIFICGGKDKKLDLSSLAELAKEKAKKIFLIGETSDILENLLLKYNFPKEEIYNLKELEIVVQKLAKMLKGSDNETILFSPAASSFDQFKNFEERGKIFKNLIFKYFS